MTHWIKAPLLLMVTNLAHNCQVFGWASACPWFSTVLQRSIPTRRGKDASPHITPVGEWRERQEEEAPHIPCSSAQRLAREGKGKNTPSPHSAAGSPGLPAAMKTTAVPPQPQPWKWHGYSCPKALRPTDPGVALWQGPRSHRHSAQLLFSSRQTLPPPHHTRISPQSLPQQVWLKPHVFSHPQNKEWGFHIRSHTAVSLFIQLFTLASNHPCNHYKLTSGETEPVCCPAKGHGPLVLLQ